MTRLITESTVEELATFIKEPPIAVRGALLALGIGPQGRRGNEGTYYREEIGGRVLAHLHNLQKLSTAEDGGGFVKTKNPFTGQDVEVYRPGGRKLSMAEKQHEFVTVKNGITGQDVEIHRPQK